MACACTYTSCKIRFCTPLRTGCSLVLQLSRQSWTNYCRAINSAVGAGRGELENDTEPVSQLPTVSPLRLSFIWSVESRTSPRPAGCGSCADARFSSQSHGLTIHEPDRQTAQEDIGLHTLEQRQDKNSKRFIGRHQDNTLHNRIGESSRCQHPRKPNAFMLRWYNKMS